MTTLVEFLTREIEEDESWAEEAREYAMGLGVTREWRWVRFYAHAGARKKHPSSSSFHKGCPSPEQVVAQCKANAEILGIHTTNTYGHPDCDICGGGGEYQIGECPTIKALAKVYADREGFKQEWA